MPVWARPKTPLGVCGFVATGRGKRTRPIHMEDIDDHPMGGQCAICQEPIKCHRTLFETECGHCFHHACATAYAISRLRGGSTQTPCPLCRTPLTKIFQTEERVPGVPMNGPYVYLHALVDVFQNGTVYGVNDGRGGRFTPLGTTTTVPNQPSVLRWISPYTGWYIVSGRSDRVREMADDFVVPRPDLADENRRLRAQVDELRRSLEGRTEATAPST